MYKSKSRLPWSRATVRDRLRLMVLRLSMDMGLALYRHRATDGTLIT